MSNLESIVPPLELCKRIPAGEFEDSALVWEKSEKYFQALDVMDYEYKVVARAESSGGFPTPTLEEILDDFFFNGAVFCKGGIRIGNDFYEYPTESEEALRLWFKVKGIEVK